MTISKKRERWKEMTREAIDIKRKILRKQKYGKGGSYASRYSKKNRVKKNDSSNNNRRQELRNGQN